MKLLNRRDRPASTPTGIPTRSESPTAASMSENVSMLSVHSPISANDANAARTPSACFQCPNRATTSVPSATVPTHVTLLKNDVNHDTRLSRKFANQLNTSKKKLGFGTLRLLLSQFWNRSR